MRFVIVLIRKMIEKEMTRSRSSPFGSVVQFNGVLYRFINDERTNLDHLKFFFTRYF